MKLRAVIFDWAGTIADFGSRAPALAFVELFRRHDVEITPAEARGPMGTAKKDHIRALTREPAIAARWLIRQATTTTTAPPRVQACGQTPHSARSKPTAKTSALNSSGASRAAES